MITHTDHLLHAVDEEGCNEEKPCGADSNSPSDGHLVVISLSQVRKMLKRYGAAYGAFNIQLKRVSLGIDSSTDHLVDIARDGGRQIPSDDDRNHGN